MKALFPGSFDPFTAGHDSIVRKALPLFGELIIAVGHNDKKQAFQSPEERVAIIRRLYQGEPRISVEAYAGLTADFAKEKGCRFIVRGLRSVKDFEYERDIAQMNKTLANVETVLLFTEPHLSALSSSVVRELISYGKDPSPFLPHND